MRARVGLREVTYGADWVVLATGGFASGGLELSSSWQAREVALDLPVAGVPGRRSASAPTTSASSPPRAPAWPWTVSCGPSTRPASGCWRTCWWSGATLAGAEPWREKSGDGISLTTGHRAAELIVGAKSAVGAGER